MAKQIQHCFRDQHDEVQNTWLCYNHIQTSLNLDGKFSGQVKQSRFPSPPDLLEAFLVEDWSDTFRHGSGQVWQPFQEDWHRSGESGLSPEGFISIPSATAG